MKAVAKVAPEVGGIEVRSVPEPSAGPGEVVIRVAAAGICGTDMQIYHWAPRMARRIELPRIMGHEVCGRIVEVGEGVGELEEGDRVALESHIFCGRCRHCRNGRAHVCQSLQYPGIDIEGGFAELVAVPARIAVPIPPELPSTVGAMLEPFGIAVHACQVGGGVAGRRVLVNGCGPIGAMNVAVARALGAQSVIATDLNGRRLALADALGADQTLDPGEVDLEEAIFDLTDGYGADVVCEYTGSPQGFDAAQSALAKGGELRLVGGPPRPHRIDLTRWLSTGITVRAIHGRRLFEDWETAFDLLRSGRIDLTALISHVLPLDQALAGFELILAGEALKPLLVPEDGA